MPSLVLEDLWVHLASDFDTSVTAVLSSLSESTERPVTTRRYANGRLIARTRPGSAQTLTFNLEFVDRATVDQLREWIGVEVMVREPRGRIVWGVYPDVQVAEIAGVAEDVADVSFVLSQVSSSAEV